MSADVQAAYTALRATLARDYPPAAPVRFVRGGHVVEGTVLRHEPADLQLPRLKVRNRKGRVYWVSLTGILAAQRAVTP